MKTAELIESVLGRGERIAPHLEKASQEEWSAIHEQAWLADTLARRLKKAIEQTDTLLDMAYCATPSKSELAAELDAIE